MFDLQRVKTGWKSLGIDMKMCCLMLKGSIPVAISLAFYQNTAVSEIYSSLGFLVSIISVVTVNLLPRAKLIEMTFTICLFTAIAVPITMLSTWSALQARIHTDPDGLHKYNSSQSAVTAVWLFFNVWLSNSLQARYSGLLIPTILYNIFVIVQYTSCSRFTTWTQCWDLIYLTVQCYYTGVAISFVSGILIYPVSCRTEFFEVTEKYIESLHGMLSGTAEYLKKLPLTSDTQPTTDDEKSPGELYGRGLRERMTGVKALYVQMHEKLPMAKREIAWGKLHAKDLTSISNLCRKILVPLGGHSTFARYIGSNRRQWRIESMRF
ncbi:hypothetical protein BCIN_12g00880 [Botrytis cinerea B05.10]|uniref:Putative ER transporter 6TM N-terminal domain-containing protein n=2 Tax=Botryotinia fuckeliana TaxID=40559 RepID=A0A384JY27_BOTFB|nr:hypothetical protein BCIN_12g00880 [Botrytis cinerea B05.10]ATZ55495.1 hypothetical protein BCIN_12g00880 [Botrytis cinerea B05.10]